MRKHLVLATVMAVVVGLLLAACGSEPTPTPRPTATPRPEAMPAPTAMMLPTPTLRPGQPHADTHAYSPRRDGRAHANGGGGGPHADA